MDRHSGEVLGEALTAPRVELAEGHGLVPGSVHAEGVTADAGEEIEDLHWPATLKVNDQSGT